MTEINYDAIKYPLQIAVKKSSSQRENRTDYTTFSVETAFNPPDVNDGDPPLQGFDGKFSRYKLSIIHKTEKNGKTVGVVYPDGNIRVDEISGIKAKSDAAMAMNTFLQSNYAGNGTKQIGRLFSDHKKIMKMLSKIGLLLNCMLGYFKTGKVDVPPSVLAQNAPSADIEALKSVAAGFTFVFGNLKGKTPLHVILEDPEKGKETLEKQRKFAADNLVKYPKNQEQLDAIDATLKLLATGALKGADGEEIVPAATDDYGSVELYTATPRTLVRKKNEESGLCPVYEISIVWHYCNRYPVEVTIVNEDAPVNEKSGGQLNPVLSQKQNVVKESFRLSIEDWYDVLDAMMDTKTNFKSLYFGYYLKIAKTTEEKNRTSAAAAKANA